MVRIARIKQQIIVFHPAFEAAGCTETNTGAFKVAIVGT